MKRLYLLLLVLCLPLLCAQETYIPEGGDGAQSGIEYVTTKDRLEDLANDPFIGRKHIILTGSITNGSYANGTATATAGGAASDSTLVDDTTVDFEADCVGGPSSPECDGLWVCFNDAAAADVGTNEGNCAVISSTTDSDNAVLDRDLAGGNIITGDPYTIVDPVLIAPTMTGAQEITVECGPGGLISSDGVDAPIIVMINGANVSNAANFIKFKGCSIIGPNDSNGYPIGVYVSNVVATRNTYILDQISTDDMSLQNASPNGRVPGGRSLVLDYSSGDGGTLTQLPAFRITNSRFAAQMPIDFLGSSGFTEIDSLTELTDDDTTVTGDPCAFFESGDFKLNQMRASVCGNMIFGNASNGRIHFWWGGEWDNPAFGAGASNDGDQSWRTERFGLFEVTGPGQFNLQGLMLNASIHPGFEPDDFPPLFYINGLTASGVLGFNVDMLDTGCIWGNSATSSLFEGDGASTIKASGLNVRLVKGYDTFVIANPCAVPSLFGTNGEDILDSTTDGNINLYGDLYRILDGVVFDVNPNCTTTITDDETLSVLYMQGCQIDNTTDVVAETFDDGDLAVPDTEVTIAGHSFTNEFGPVQLTTDGVLPTPLALVTDYWINVVDANTIEFSATKGGASITMTVENGGNHTITYLGNVISLPSATEGMEVSVGLTKDYDMDINPHDNDQILQLTDSDGDAISSDASAGTSVQLRANSEGNWVPTSTIGTWTDVN